MKNLAFFVLATVFSGVVQAGEPPFWLFAGGVNRRIELVWQTVPQTNYYETWFRANNGTPLVKLSTLSSARTGSYNHVSAHLLNWEEARYQVRGCNPSGCIASPEVGVSGQWGGAIAVIKPSRTQSGAKFGSAIDLSEDGATLVSVSPSETDVQSGRQSIVNIYLFNSHHLEYWKQETRIFPSVTQRDNGAGVVANLSGDGNVLIVGIPAERTSASTTAPEVGAVYLFRRVQDGTWRQERRFAPAAGATPAHYGFAAEISEDGNTLLIGRETAGGTAEIYTYAGGAWTLAATVPGPGNQTDCNRIRLSGDGQVIARTCARPPFYQALQVFRAPSYALAFEDNIFTTDDVSFADLASDYKGETFTWSQLGNNPGSPELVSYRRYEAGIVTRNGSATQTWTWRNESIAQSEFGARVALSRDGKYLAIRDMNDTGAGNGPHPFSLSKGTRATGAVFIYEWNGTSGGLHQRRILKPNYPPPAQGRFGAELAFANDGKTLAVSQPGDDSAATTPYHHYSEEVKPDAGAVWIY